MKNLITIAFASLSLAVIAACAGPEGPPGADGATGPAGEAGADGTDGVDGEDGTDGVDGEDGTDGVDGAPGVDGEDGIDGLDGTGLPGVFDFRQNSAGSYARVDRMGMPAINTAVISSGNKDAYNAADPVDDAAGDFVADITANVTGLHAALDDDLAGLGLTPCAAADCVGQAAPLVVPDTLKIDTSAAAGFPNGRLLTDPVIDVTLAVVLLDLGTHGAGTLAGVPVNPPANDVAFDAAFPYLADPH